MLSNASRKLHNTYRDDVDTLRFPGFERWGQGGMFGSCRVLQCSDSTCLTQVNLQMCRRRFNAFCTTLEYKMLFSCVPYYYNSAMIYPQTLFQSLRPLWPYNLINSFWNPCKSPLMNPSLILKASTIKFPSSRCQPRTPGAALCLGSLMWGLSLGV